MEYSKYSHLVDTKKLIFDVLVNIVDVSGNIVDKLAKTAGIGLILLIS